MLIKAARVHHGVQFNQQRREFQALNMADSVAVPVAVFAALIAAVSGHGAMVSPLSRNAVDSLVGVNTQRCSNITGDKCNNGQGDTRSGGGVVQRK